MTGIKCMDVLKALSDLNRLRITRLLLKEPLGVNEIARRLKITQYNASKHLRVLREAGLLEVERLGQQRLYGVARKLRAQLSANGNVLQLECCSFRFDKLPK
jgi:DNA-binding transcriptional ArsR family regulator